MKQQRIPRLSLWRGRYQAYRHKYGRLKALWRGIVLTELYMFCKGIVEDDKDLLEHLIHVEATDVRFHL